MFNTDIRAIISQIAMSAGTMIACSCKTIIMGKHSNIGPIDPQFNGIPAHGVLSEFQRALKEVKDDPNTIPIWQTIVAKYHPTFIGECENAIVLASQIVTQWLETGMFVGDSQQKKIVQSIVDKLNNHDDTKTHARHIHINEAKTYGLKIQAVETDFDPEFQELLLTTHHAFMHTFAHSNAVKIIENHQGNTVIQNQPFRER